MNEVTKLYENAEPNRDCNLYKHFTECPMKHTQCEDCENFVYPSFTAEKQLELIKWLSDTDYYIHNLYKTIDTKEYCIENDFYDIQANEFEEALANLVNKLWQDLTEEERKQIADILKG